MRYIHLGFQFQLPTIIGGANFLYRKSPNKCTLITPFSVSALNVG